MGYSFQAYGVPWELTKNSIGIKDKSTRMELRRNVAANVAGDRKDFSIGVSNLLIGPPYAAPAYSNEAAYLGYALEGLCRVRGSMLEDNICPCDVSYPSMVADQIKKFGVDLNGTILYRGPPFEIPPGADFPTIGYATPEEVVSIYSKLENIDFRSMDPNVPEFEQLEHCELFRTWFRLAAQRKQGIITFLY